MRVKRSVAGKLYLSGAFLLAGTSVVAAKYVAQQLGVFTIAAASLVFALALLVPLCGRKRMKTLRNVSRNLLRRVFLQALFGIFLFRMFLLMGLSATSSAEAGILTGATPEITAFLAWAFLRERASRFTLAGMLLTVTGVLCIQGAFDAGAALDARHIAGNLLVLCAAASESTFNILSRSMAVATETSDAPMDALAQTTLVVCIALGLCLIPAAFENPLARLSTIGAEGWLALVWYGAGVTALAFLCWYAGIRRSSAFTAAAFSGLMPLSAMALSTLLLGEQLRLSQWIGGGLVIAAMTLIGVTGAERRRNGVARADRREGAEPPATTDATEL